MVTAQKNLEDMHHAQGAVKQPVNLVAIAAAMITVAGLCVVGRLYSHLVLTKNSGIDDIFIVIAWCTSLIVVVAFVERE